MLKPKDRPERIHISLPETLLETFDIYLFDLNMNRSEAIRALIEQEIESSIEQEIKCLTQK